MRRPYRNKRAWLIGLALTASGCATPLPVSPPVVKSPEIPSMPLVAEPPPSGTYWQMLIDWRESLRRRLSDTPLK